MYSVRHISHPYVKHKFELAQISADVSKQNTSLFPSGRVVTPCALQIGLSQPCCCYSASLPSDSYSVL